MRLGMKIFYIVLFLSIYTSLVMIVGSHSIFNLIIFIFPSFFFAWVIPQFFKDAIVPFFNWFAKFIPKSGD